MTTSRMPQRGEPLELPVDERPPGDLEHRLGNAFGARAHPGGQAAGEDHRLHRLLRVVNRRAHRTRRMTQGCFQGFAPCGSNASYTACPGKRATTATAGTFAGTDSSNGERSKNMPLRA